MLGQVVQRSLLHYLPLYLDILNLQGKEWRNGSEGKRPVALTEDQGLVPIMHIWQLTTTSSRVSDAPFWPPQALQMMCMHARTDTHTNK